MNPSALASKASKKFAQFGQSMTFVQETESSSPNPSTGLADIVQTRTAFKGMWDNVQLNELGTLLQVGDAVIWTGGDAIPTPDITDWVEVDGKAWDIVNIESTKPGAVAIVYKLYVREAGTATNHTRRAG